VQGRQACFASIPRIVTRSQNRVLECDITVEEVQKATKSLPTGKALGLDLIPTEFFQLFWDEVGPAVMELVKEVLSTGSLHPTLNTSRIALIPKVRDLSLITNYRPISLLSTLYKIIAKLLANRLVPNLHKWIRRSQIGFDKGCCIFDNVYLAVKAMSWAEESNQDLALILLDFEKAYDRISWSFLTSTLLRLGFLDRWIRMVMVLNREGEAIVTLNG
jgi:hypothetical protein